MRKSNPTQLRAQAVDYGTMIHVELMKEREGDVRLSDEVEAILKEYAVDDRGHALRALFRQILINDLSKLDVL